MRPVASFVVAAATLLIVPGTAGAHHAAVPFPAPLGMLQQTGGATGAPAPGMASTRAGATAAATPKAYGDCGPGALPETGLQGQVPRADQDSGRSKRGYRCNLRLVGQNDIRNRGANFQLAWYRDCAYVSIVGNQLSQSTATEPPHPLEGVAVIDASNPRRPQLVRILRSPVGRTQHEAVEVNERRGMLVVQIGGIFARWIEIYDVSGGCRNPVFKSRYDAGEDVFHGQRISDDGMTLYATDQAGSSGRAVDVFDVSDMARPRLIRQWDLPQCCGVHDLDVNAGGTRAYLGTSNPGTAIGDLVAGPPSSSGGPSLVTVDTTDIQGRRDNPDLKVVSQLELPNFGHTEQRARIRGRPYVFTSGETPAVGAKNCPWAWGDVIDMSDERNPRPVSEIKLEVNEPSNCQSTGQDDAVYSIHYSGVDDERDTTKVFYTYYTAGLRVFDVRDPARPKEVGYYHPVPRESTVFAPSSPVLADVHRPTWDSATSVVRYRPETGHIWYVSIAGGFQILEGTGALRPCLARRSPIGPRNIGRVRLGYTRRRLLRGVGVPPIRRTRRTFRYCVKGRAGRVTAVFSRRSRRGRVELVTTTARGHGNRRVAVRSRAGRFRRAYPNRRRIARGLYRAGPRSRRLFGLRRGRVRFVSVASRRLLRNRRALRRSLRLAGL